MILAGDLTRLEPYLSERNLDYHINKIESELHTRLQKMGSALPDRSEMETFLRQLPSGAAQEIAFEIYNHQHYWATLTIRPGRAGEELLSLAERDFGSFELLLENLRSHFENMRPGWLYLSLTGDGLKIGSSEHPLLGSEKLLLCIDAWEHAYYLDYQHRRMDYLQALLLKLIDWELVTRRLKPADNPPLLS